jgi:hypothetical protein
MESSMKKCIRVLPTCNGKATMEALSKDGKWKPFCWVCGRLVAAGVKTRKISEE